MKNKTNSEERKEGKSKTASYNTAMIDWRH